MNYLSRLTRKEKIGILYIPLFALGMVASSMVINPSALAEGPNTSALQSVSDSVAASPQNTAKASASPTTQVSAPLTFSNEDVSHTELTTMQQSATEGLTNFYQWKAGESAAERTKRISPYFSSTSPSLNTSPDGSLLSDPKNSSLSLISQGSINFMKPINGNSSEYKLSVSVTVSGQYNYLKNSQQNQSMILEKVNAVFVIMKKIDGAWKIESIAENK
jgi:hypothetical protein